MIHPSLQIHPNSNVFLLGKHSLMSGYKNHSYHTEKWRCTHSVQFSCSVVSDSLRPHGVQHARVPVHHQLLELAQTHVHQVADAIQHLILYHPLLLLPSIFPSIRVFSSESVLRVRWPKYWSFSISISPPSEYSGLIAFRIDWFNLAPIRKPLKRHAWHLLTGQHFFSPLTKPFPRASQVAQR